MKHLSPVNEKARRLTEALEPASPSSSADVVALQQQPPAPPQQPPQQPPPPPGPHVPLGCSTVFAPGWEVDRTGGTAGLCQPVERDLFDCHLGCFWPAQVPDQLNHAPDWTKKCAAAQKDWRQIDVIFP